MVKKSYTFISKDPKILIAILELRKMGLSLDFIADLYNCDRTSLRYQCRKYQIFPLKTIFVRNDKSPEIYNPKRIASQIILNFAPHEVSNWTIIDGERINTGKSYLDYLKEAKNTITTTSFH